MRIFLTLVLPIVFLARSQGQQTKKHIPNLRARQLHDSAMTLAMKFGNKEQIIALLDQATETDSNFYLAYWNKLVFQMELNQFGKALNTAKNLIRIQPETPDSYVTMGILYEKNGDSLSAQKHFNEALSRYDKILDTISTSNTKYETFLMNKAVNLIFIGQEEKGNKILQELYDKQKDDLHKEIYRQFLGKSKKEILEEFFDQTVVESNPIIKN